MDSDLTQVMRLKTGDSLLVFNGRDGEWRCVIAEVLKKGVVLRAEERVRPQTTGPDLELLISVVKKEHWAMQEIPAEFRSKIQLDWELSTGHIVSKEKQFVALVLF